MRRKLWWFIHLWAHGQGKGDEHPTYAHSGMVRFTFTFTLRKRNITFLRLCCFQFAMRHTNCILYIYVSLHTTNISHESVKSYVTLNTNKAFRRPVFPGKINKQQQIHKKQNLAIMQCSCILCNSNTLAHTLVQKEFFSK